MSHMTYYPENKNTLFSPTLKMEENKLPLFFGSEAKWMSHGHSEFSEDVVFGHLRLKSQNGHRSLILPLI